MAKLLIGRVVDWNALGNIERVPLGPETFTLNGRITTDDADKANAIRDQILGLGQDEGEVPLRIVEEPTLDGMVAIDSTTCEVEAGGLERGRYPWTITGRRLPGGALPNVEAPLLGGLRSNVNGIAAANAKPWHAYPGGTLDYWDGLSAFAPGAVDMDTESGPIKYARFGTGLAARTARMTIPPASWYQGAACVEQVDGNGDYYCLTGRGLPRGTGSSGWRIGNGLIRVRPSSTPGRLELQLWQAGAWGTVHKFRLDAYDGVTAYEVNRINTVAVIKNTPEECRVRLSLGLYAAGVNYDHRTLLTIKIRRGARVAEFRWVTHGTPLLGTVTPDPAEAGTGLFIFAAGGTTNTADAQGNTAILMTPAATSFSNASSALDSTGTPSLAWSFGLGIIKGGGGAAAPWDAGSLRQEYFAPMSDRFTVVGW